MTRVKYPHSIEHIINMNEHFGREMISAMGEDQYISDRRLDFFNASFRRIKPVDSVAEPKG